jgi:hypothetical protein
MGILERAGGLRKGSVSLFAEALLGGLLSGDPKGHEEEG